MNMSVQSSTQPLVTIGMPVYNSERHVAQAIESLLAQTCTDFVLVISDNASTDGTAGICQDFVKKDSRVQYYRNSVNIGLTGNFNRVFELARTKYFKWATADDYSAPEMLADALQIMESDPSIALCYPRAIIVDDLGNEQRRYDDKLNLMQDNSVERFLTLLREIGLVNHHLGLLRTDAVRRTRLFGKHVYADVGFLAELSLYGKFREVQKYQFFRRFHPNSSSWNRGDPAHEIRRFHAARVIRVPFNTWRFHGAFIGAIWRSPLSIADKLKVGRVLIKRLYWDLTPLRRELVKDLPLLFK